jgi:hypothetical protein
MSKLNVPIILLLINRGFDLSKLYKACYLYKVTII